LFVDDLGDGGYVDCYEMTDIESKLGLGRDSLVTDPWLFNILRNHNVCLLYFLILLFNRWFFIVHCCSIQFS